MIRDATLVTIPDLQASKADVGDVTAALALKAPLVSPIFSGNPEAPTAAPGDNDTSIATTAFVTAAVAVASPISHPDLLAFAAAN